MGVVQRRLHGETPVQILPRVRLSPDGDVHHRPGPPGCPLGVDNGHGDREHTGGQSCRLIATRVRRGGIVLESKSNRRCATDDSCRTHD